MEQIKEYKVVLSTTLEDLQNQIAISIGLGFQPFGSISITSNVIPSGRNGDITSSSKIYLAQAVVKY